MEQKVVPSWGFARDPLAQCQDEVPTLRALRRLTSAFPWRHALQAPGALPP